jgi:hypothetical protein
MGYYIQSQGCMHSALYQHIAMGLSLAAPVLTILAHHGQPFYHLPMSLPNDRFNIEGQAPQRIDQGKYKVNKYVSTRFRGRGQTHWQETKHTLSCIFYA